VLTVAVTLVNLGAFNLWAALIIATVKASLVALYFMHLRYDESFNAIVLMAALIFLSLFVGLALLDTQHYRNDLIPGYAPAIEKQAP
jgi:cytochrome c oxidase subunit 4